MAKGGLGLVSKKNFPEALKRKIRYLSNFVLA
jgi:hypothetical protein